MSDTDYTLSPIGFLHSPLKSREEAPNQGHDGHLLVGLEQFQLSRKLPLALLPPDTAPIAPPPLPDTLEPVPA